MQTKIPAKKLVGTRSGGILTYSGRMVVPFDPDPADICIEDMAHATALTCRFSGHCRFGWSVAQHQLLVAAILVAMGHPELAIAGLLHDTAEAYLTDIPRPFKNLITDYKEVEGRLLDAIFASLDLPFTHLLPMEVKRADDIALAIEQFYLMPVSEYWPRIFTQEDIDYWVDTLPHRYLPIGPHMPHTAELEWSLKLQQLLEERKDATNSAS